MDNEEVAELTKKAKDNKTVNVKTRKKETKPRNRQPTKNPDKENVIQLIAEALSVPASITDVKITNKTKYITFRLNDKDFEVNLIEKRKKKE